MRLVKPVKTARYNHIAVVIDREEFPTLYQEWIEKMEEVLFKGHFLEKHWMVSLETKERLPVVLVNNPRGMLPQDSYI